ncbi:hypothetical protein J2X31_003487 [Flavobacterium arsenatis]|uniref:Lipoprotein n=2 Tax=Flavobacterium arsenatis TaxID=1484332 RepID=A0ABU1TUE1_9FLAO|nr:hypothetical protein [Flavobacterium arsenatis]
MYKGKLPIFLLFFIVLSCGITKQKYVIDDYTIVPNAKEVLGNKGLSAFVFENNKKLLPFQQFITNKFKLDSYQEKEFWVTIDGDKYKIILYDNDELIKYINTSDFTLANQNPDVVNVGSTADFIALSMISSRNEDCLAEGSLYENIAVKYLKQLKDDYLSNDR